MVITMLKKLSKHRKAIAGCLLALYVVFIFSVTLLFRKPTDEEHLRLELFWSYKVIDEQFWQMFLNLLLFIPFGFLLQVLDKRICLTILIGFLLSCSIEMLQFLLKLGLCEFDDVFHNTLGTIIGSLIELLTVRIISDHKKSIDDDARNSN